MERNLAERILEEVAKQHSYQGRPYLTLLEVMAMTKVMSDGYDIYAITKGDVTVLARVHVDGSITIKGECW